LAGTVTSRNMVSGVIPLVFSSVLALGFILIFFILNKLESKLNLFVRIIIFGLLVVLLEFGFGYLNSFGPWTSSGYSLFPILKYLNLLPFFGSFGVYFYSFIYSVSAFLTFELIIRFKEVPARNLIARTLFAVLLFSLILPTFATFLYKPKNKSLRVGLVNSDTSSNDNLEIKLRRITKIAQDSDLVLTGEAFFRFVSVAQQIQTFDSLSLIAKQSGSYIFVGLISIGEDSKLDQSNKLFGWNPKGDIVMNYTKANLLPNEKPSFNKGKLEIPFVDTEFGRIGGVICFDSDHPDYIVQSKSKKLDILLAPVKEWSGIEARHTQQIAFRAKENGVVVINSAVNGQNRITNPNGEEIFSSFSQPNGKSDKVVMVEY
jgi:apolipoprotein N-acyltransferase